MSEFAQRVMAWQRASGRHDLPWQGTRDPYLIWLSEVMLQQTQVTTVIPYYRRFVECFPDVVALAQAPLEQVFELWSGLGYYRRARHLHDAARRVCDQHDGIFPTDAGVLESLPGVGRSTAAAIAVFSAHQRVAILDGNVKRVFCRHDAIAEVASSSGALSRLWALAESRLPEQGVEVYTQGLMDLGATLCTRTRPRCDRCPVAATCQALADGDPSRYPVRQLRREVPQRMLTPLVMLAGRRVLLQRRPDKGIWGGLWSLPEVDIPRLSAGQVVAHGLSMMEVSASRAAMAMTKPSILPAQEPTGPAVVTDATDVAGVSSVRRLPAFDHALTHFRLRIEPWLIVLDAITAARVSAHDADADRRWLPLDECAQAALPQPIKRLLLALGDASSGGAGLDDLPLFQELVDQ